MDWRRDWGRGCGRLDEQYSRADGFSASDILGAIEISRIACVSHHGKNWPEKRGRLQRTQLCTFCTRQQRFPIPADSVSMFGSHALSSFFDKVWRWPMTLLPFVDGNTTDHVSEFVQPSVESF